MAVSQSGSALQYADDSLQADPEVVFKAISNSGAALEYADESLRNNRDIVLRAVTSSGHALQHASDTLKEDKEIFHSIFLLQILLEQLLQFFQSAQPC